MGQYGICICGTLWCLHTKERRNVVCLNALASVMNTVESKVNFSTTVVMHVKYELGGRRGPAMFAEVGHRSAVWPLASVTAMCEALIRSRSMGDYHFSFRNSHISV